MPAPRRTQKEAPKYKNSDESEGDGDFSDSGSEASIPDDAQDEDSDLNSGDDFTEEPVKKYSKKKLNHNRSVATSSKSCAVTHKKTPQINFQSLKSRMDAIQDDFNNAESEIPFSVKDLTDQEKMLPSFLNLSESDSSDNDDDTEKRRPSTFSDEPMDFNSFISKDAGSKLDEKADTHKIKASSMQVGRLSDSDSDIDNVSEQTKNVPDEESNSTKSKEVTFDHLRDHSKKIEEAKISLELYKKRYSSEKKDTVDVTSLLAMGETKEEKPNLKKKIASRKHGNMSDSDVEDFEEVKGEAKSQANLPKGGLQLVLDFPTDRPKPKKAIDLEMMLKRRLNRIKKEYQVYIHKVHILCWLGHGNHVNKILNNENVMAAALSLIPSEHCYPSSRINIKYMEQITKWYSREMTVKEDKSELKFKPNKQPLNESLLQQINKKTVPSIKNKVLIFISMLRALGIKTRLVFSFKVLPLRPTELCSLATKKNETSKTAAKVETSKHFKASSSKDSKSSKNVKSRKSMGPDDKISQLDGADDRNIRDSKRKTTSKETSKKSLSLTKKNIVEKSTECSSSTETSSTTAGSSSFTLSYWDQITKGLLADPSDTGERTSHRDLKTDISPKATVKKELKTPDSVRSSRYFSESHVSSSDNSRIHSDSTVLLNHSNIIKDEPLSSQESVLSSPSDESVTPKRKLISSIRQSERTQASVNSRKSKSTDNSNAKSLNKQTKVSNKTTDVKEAKSNNKLTSEKSAINGNALKSTNNAPSANSSSRHQKNELKRKHIIEVSKTKTDRIDLPKRFTRSSSASSVRTVVSLGDTRMCLTPDINEEEIKTNVAKRSTVKSLAEKGKSSTIGKEKIVQPKAKSNEDPKTEKPQVKKTIQRKTKSLGSSETSEYFKSDDNFKPSQRQARSRRVSHKDLANKSLQDKPSSSEVPTRNIVKEIVALTKNKSSTSKKINSQAKKSSVNYHNDYEPEDEIESRRIRKHSNASEADFKPTKKRLSSQIAGKRDRRVLSTDDEHSIDETKKRGVDVWCEVYVEEEEQWISIDVIKSQVHCAREIYSRASHPVTYIVSWDAAGHIKDVTRRYVPHWNTTTRKLRTDPGWYDTALKPFLAPRNMRDVQEDKQLDRMLMDAPLPNTVGEYKNHPLYALKRHLLKFEVIYPPDAMTLGFVRNEPVYPRECVHTCRSRETWVKEAKVVKPGEEPYKIVKARPKYDRSSGKMITDIPLEIFGPWQCDEYVPPQAENGIVPRNPYGNVELFKACMLPKGTVHLQLPGLNKVARKLGIDCASAMTGFDYHSGWSHPVYDGFVVCEEFEHQIILAWEEEQEDAEKRAKEKVEKRVYGNWKRLIRGLFIKARLQAKYEFQPEVEEEQQASLSKSTKRSKGPRSSTKKRKSCSESESD